MAMAWWSIGWIPAWSETIGAILIRFIFSVQGKPYWTAEQATWQSLAMAEQVLRITSEQQTCKRSFPMGRWSMQTEQTAALHWTTFRFRTMEHWHSQYRLQTFPVRNSGKPATIVRSLRIPWRMIWQLPQMARCICFQLLPILQPCIGWKRTKRWLQSASRFPAVCTIQSWSFVMERHMCSIRIMIISRISASGMKTGSSGKNAMWGQNLHSIKTLQQMANSFILPAPRVHSRMRCRHIATIRTPDKQRKLERISLETLAIWRLLPQMERSWSAIGIWLQTAFQKQRFITEQLGILLHCPSRNAAWFPW